MNLRSLRIVATPHECVTAHARINHNTHIKKCFWKWVTSINELHHTRKKTQRTPSTKERLNHHWIMVHPYINHGTNMIESWYTENEVKSHVFTHGTQKKKSSPTYLHMVHRKRSQVPRLHVLTSCDIICKYVGLKSHVFTSRDPCVNTGLKGHVTLGTQGSRIYVLTSCDITLIWSHVISLSGHQAPRSRHIYTQIMAHIWLSLVPHIHEWSHLRATKRLGAAKQINHGTHIYTNHGTYIIWVTSHELTHYITCGPPSA